MGENSSLRKIEGLIANVKCRNNPKKISVKVSPQIYRDICDELVKSSPYIYKISQDEDTELYDKNTFYLRGIVYGADFALEKNDFVLEWE